MDRRSPTGEIATRVPWDYQDIWLAGFAGGAGRDIECAPRQERVPHSLVAERAIRCWSARNIGTTVGLWRLKPDGSSAPVALGGVMPANAYWIDVDVDARGDIVFIGQTKSDPYELYLVPAGGGADGRADAGERGDSAIWRWRAPRP